jgi:eukaryotic-like serine/threonine-protein kinase
MTLTPLFLAQNRKDTFHVPSQIKSINSKNYEIQERISNGGNAVVHKCVGTASGQEYAIKFQLTPFNNKRLQRFYQEIELIKQVKHDQLISYIDQGEVDFYKKSNTSRKLEKVEGKKIPFLVMNLANNNLCDIRKDKKIPYEEYIGQFKGLASALASLHEKAIHRDIKPENVLIAGETWILSDFGLCKFTDEESETELTSEYETIGPRFWMSPESLNRSLGNPDEISKYSDVFQLCSIFWYVINGRHPLGVISKDDWQGPDHLFDVIYNALSHNASKRPSDGYELLEQLEHAILSV